MHIKTLESISPEKVLETFNLAFSDYMIPINLSSEQFKQKLFTENIDLGISVGVFNENTLVGFILHGNRLLDGKKTFYNAGTGVIPAERGHALTTRMYDFILPLLKKQGYNQGLLEVISTNEAAIHVYKKTGFTRTRSLECYRGSPQSLFVDSEIEMEETKALDWELFQRFWDWMPAWQYMPETIDLESDSLRKTLAKKDGVIVGYALLDRKSNRLKHLAVSKAHRKQLIGSSMIAYLSPGKALSVINVDGNDDATNAFMRKLGLEHFLRQYEMSLSID